MADLSAQDRANLGTIRPELLDKLMLLKARMDAAGYATFVPEYGGYRDAATQRALYDDAIAQGGGQLAYPVATPGHSRHEYGAAFDLHMRDYEGSDAAYAYMAAVAEGIGLVAGYYFADRGVGQADPYHFQLDESLATSVAQWAARGVGGVAGVAKAGGLALLVAAVVSATRRQ